MNNRQKEADVRLRTGLEELSQWDDFSVDADERFSFRASQLGVPFWIGKIYIDCPEGAKAALMEFEVTGEIEFDADIPIKTQKTPTCVDRNAIGELLIRQGFNPKAVAVTLKATTHLSDAEFMRRVKRLTGLK